MKLVVEAFNYNHALACINDNVDVIIVGNENFATSLSYSFNEQEINHLILNKNKTEIWVKVNAIFFEQDLNRLYSYLKWLNSLEVDKVVFQDLAIAQLVQENNWTLKLDYCPETLVTSYGQLDFYKKVGFDSVFLARELTYKELTEILEHKQGLKLSIQGHGYAFVMHSRWKMINNFEQYYSINPEQLDKDYLLIQEELRKYPDIIFEDKHGTHMLTGYMIYTIDIIDKLQALNLDYLKLDFIKTNEQYAKDMTKLYMLAIKNKLDKKELEDFFNLNKSYILTHNFLGGIKEILGLTKKEEE